jgi:hypothetical protein
MTAREELEFGRRVQKGCQKARTEFMQRNLKLVIDLAGRYRGRDWMLLIWSKKAISARCGRWISTILKWDIASRFMLLGGFVRPWNVP